MKNHKNNKSLYNRPNYCSLKWHYHSSHNHIHYHNSAYDNVQFDCLCNPPPLKPTCNCNIDGGTF